MSSPSDKNCRKCSKVLTQGEKKTCYHRNDNNPDFVCNPCYYNRTPTQQPNREQPNEKGEYNRLTGLIQGSKTLTELERNYQTVKSSPLYDSNKKTWENSWDDNKTCLDKAYNSSKGRFCTSCLNHVEYHQTNCPKKCKKCNHSVLDNKSVCHNIDCENYWAKHTKIDKVDNIDYPIYNPKKGKEKQIQQLRNRISELEAITNRTAEQERELQEKRSQLARLENQQRSGGENSKEPTNYLPWIIGGIGIIAIVGVISYLLLKKKRK